MLSMPRSDGPRGISHSMWISQWREMVLLPSPLPSLIPTISCQKQLTMSCGSFQLLILLDEAVPVICAELRVMRLLPAPDGSSTMSRSHPSIHNGPMLAWSHVQGTTLVQDRPSIGDPHPSRVSSHEAQEPVLRLDEPHPSFSIHTPTRRYRIPSGRFTAEMGRSIAFVFWC